MAEVSTYWDYREFLRDYYEERKQGNWYFSYRYLGQKLGTDAGYLVKVLKLQAHLADHCLDKLVILLGLTGKDEDYLRTLFRFSKAAQPGERREAYERLVELRGFPTQLLENESSEYFRQWHYSVVRSLVGLEPQGDSAALAARLRPAIPEAEAKQALQLLEALGMIHKESDGRFALVEGYVSNGPAVQVDAVRRFQRETIRMAAEALDAIPPSERDITSVTVTLSGEDLLEARERAKAFRESILQLSSESRGQREVYQLNLQLFPVTGIPTSKVKGNP